MNNKCFLTVFTPTYNRAHTLTRLYESLTRQSDFYFEWIVVDDGSTDNTESLINEFSKKENKFPIVYYKQPNGGKHRAINRGVKMAQGDWFIILDSDDWLSANAVDIIRKRTIEIQNDSRFCSITGLRVSPENITIGDECNYDSIDTNFFDYRFKYKVIGDRAEVIRTSVMKKFPFHEFEGENFLGEGSVWYNMSKEYITRYTNDRFYICEYQSGGLTDTFQQRCDKNPCGAMLSKLTILRHPHCGIKDWIFANSAYFHYYNIFKESGKPILEELKPTKMMRIINMFNPLLKIVYRIINK